MLTRALIVLLLVLNLGVAAWWAFGPGTSAPAVSAIDPAVARLQLVQEVPTLPHRLVDNQAAMAVPATAAPACFEIGPFNDDATLDQARSTLQTQVARLSIRREPARGRGWRVWLPPMNDRAAAQAMAERIVSAGFKDYYIVPNGDEANSIALGRYGNEEAAQRRQADLRAAGFPAQAEALGGGARWLQVAATPAFDVARVQPSIAAQQRPLDCATLR
jgi:hypothetical protein